MKWIKKHLASVLLAIIFLIGTGVMLYPTISAAWNSRVQSRVISSYNEIVSSMSEKNYTEYLSKAKTYNEKLYQTGSGRVLVNPDLVEGYEDMLRISGDGVMGYIIIDKINVKLPIYHGTSESALSAGAGHLEGSSLPIGGENTHSVISAHRGLPNATMFTNLDKMEIGDIFELHVLNETLYYQVNQILTVLPEETQALYIESGKDYCTLMTCTPYGINTHRLLIRGERIDKPEEDVIDEIKDEQDEEEIDETVRFIIFIAIVIIAMAVIIIVISSIIVAILKFFRKKKRNGKNSE